MGLRCLKQKANWYVTPFLSSFSYLLKAGLYFVSEKSVSTYITVNKLSEFSGYRQISPCNSLVVVVDFSPEVFFSASARGDKEAKKIAL